MCLASNRFQISGEVSLKPICILQKPKKIPRQAKFPASSFALSSSRVPPPKDSMEASPVHPPPATRGHPSSYQLSSHTGGRYRTPPLAHARFLVRCKPEVC